MPQYPRRELEETMERWLQANRDAQAENNWVKHLGPFYRDDADYSWNLGPNEDFQAHGREQIEAWALGVQMQGFDGWQYPYDRVLIDEVQGEIVAFWRQVAPVRRPDGSPYEVAGLGGSWFRYGGNYQWAWQRDFFDFGNAKALFMELAAAGLLAPAIKRKIQDVTRGRGLAGHVRRPTALSAVDQARGMLVLGRIALLGR